jgi:hypothetical protein
VLKDARTARRGWLPVAALAALAALWLCDDAPAAVLRGPVPTLGALALALPLLVLREWPSGLAPLWVAGTLLAAGVWLCRTRPLPAWLSFRLVPTDSRPGMPFAPLLTPAGDGAAVLESVRRCFLDLQAAWDARDTTVLRARTTADMFAELQDGLAQRGTGRDRTDVVTLEAELLALERIGAREVASVAFSGMIRESADAGAAPFREVWMLVREAGADWRLARHQALL